jgi:acetyl esterase/lipase
VSPYAAPARAVSLEGLPASYLDVGSVEIFRDDVLSYAARLLESGVPTELHLWAGGTHGFDQMVPAADVSRAARAAQTSYVRRALRRGRGS